MKDPQESRLPDTFSDLLRALQIVKDFPRPWCVCGGWAIDLFLNHITRPHKDVDFAVWTPDQLALQAYITAQGWSLEKVVEGRLLPWAEGEFIELPVYTIWCKHQGAKPDFFEILLNEVQDQPFLFHRNPSIARPLSAAVIRLVSGIPILAPEIVLLYKANNLAHAGNRTDFGSAAHGCGARWILCIPGMNGLVGCNQSGISYGRLAVGMVNVWTAPRCLINFPQSNQIA